MTNFDAVGCSEHCSEVMGFFFLGGGGGVIMQKEGKHSEASLFC